MTENCQKKNDQKMAKMNLKWPKMTQNGQKQPKTGQKWSEMFRQLVQMRPVISTPNCLTENGEKLPKNDRKIAKMTLKWPKMA